VRMVTAALPKVVFLPRNKHRPQPVRRLRVGWFHADGAR
jgi:hypothetical protein